MQVEVTKSSIRELAKMEVSFKKFMFLINRRSTDLVPDDIINFDSFKDKETHLKEMYIFTKKIKNKIRCEVWAVGESINIKKNGNNVFSMRGSRIHIKPKYTIPQAVKDKAWKLSELVPITFESIKVGEHLFELEFPKVNVWEVISKCEIGRGDIEIILGLNGKVETYNLTVGKKNRNSESIYSYREKTKLFFTTPQEIDKFLTKGLYQSLKDSYKYSDQKFYYELED